jgi:hypothetical protein
LLRADLRFVNARINDLAGRRQRLWLQPHRLTTERLLELTRELNGHARDIDALEPSRFLRKDGLFALKRRLLAGSES